MRRYFSQSRGSRLTANKQPSGTEVQENKPHQRSDGSSDDTDPTAAAPLPPVPPANLKVKRVDHYWSSWSKAWKYRNTGSGVIAEAARPVGNGSDNDPWQTFCFVVVRKLPNPQQQYNGVEITFQIVVKSPFLLMACKDVIGKVYGISWTAEPLELDPHLLLAFFPQFEAYEQTLRKKSRSPEEENVYKTVGVLLDFLRKDYRATLAKIANLTAHGEITFDLLYAIFVPHTIVVTECPIMGEPRALKLLQAQKVETAMHKGYKLLCESVDLVEQGALGSSDHAHQIASAQQARLAALRPGRSPPLVGATSALSGGILPRQSDPFGRVQSIIVVSGFKGTVPIHSLEAYPIQYCPNADTLKAALLERGCKWVSLRGIHHLHYEGTAAFTVHSGGEKKVIKYNVNSRVMIDKRESTEFYHGYNFGRERQVFAEKFVRLNPNYSMPKPAIQNTTPNENPNQHLQGLQRLSHAAQPPPVDPPVLDVRAKHQPDAEASLTDEELLLASPILYGFSFSDKMWLEFNVEHLRPIKWNEEAFEGLVLAADRKNLLRSLVDAHKAELGFDDFVQGKGQGLIINLFGPPGVGKTLSAEATSEHVHRPLYVVGGGDLGTTAAQLDASLERVFDIATSWKAIVLIDEADVFLERRSLHDLERNAMVAVFLRHVEYYRGILFLTTNRVKAFDEAFLSRIHVALHFGELTTSAKMQVWRAFLRKACVPASSIGDDLLQQLAERDVNGRQIKNACRTAQSLALSRGEPLGFAHLTETLDAMEEFTEQFAALVKAA